MARDPDRILEDVEGLLHDLEREGYRTAMWPVYAQIELLKEISDLRKEMRNIDELEKQQKQQQQEERLPRIYLVEHGEGMQSRASKEADLIIRFTDNIGLHEGTMRTEVKITKNRWGSPGPAEVIENPAW